MMEEMDSDSEAEPETLQWKQALVADTYSGALVAIMRWKGTRFGVNDQRTPNILFGAVVANMLLHLLNLVLQVLLLFVVVAYTVERREDEFELKRMPTVYLDRAIDHQTPLNTTIDVEARTLEDCMRDHTVAGTTLAVIFLWGVKMLSEGLESLYDLLRLMHLPLANEDGKLVELNACKDGMIITHITKGLRVFFALVIYTPKLLLSIVLWWIGAKFLIYAPSPGELIMKALCLSYISTIDNMLFTGLASVRFRNHVAGTKLVYLDNPEHVLWRNWGATVVKFLVVSCISMSIVYFWFWHVSQFRIACRTYKTTFLGSCQGHNCGYRFFGMHFIS